LYAEVPPLKQSAFRISKTGSRNLTGIILKVDSCVGQEKERTSFQKRQAPPKTTLAFWGFDVLS